MHMKDCTRLDDLGVFGFGRAEPVIYAALVTEDPLLLIGASGTGKTYLLNSLSEALRLDHRHYNASLISFDDLVGFPYPDQENGGVRFLETPATVWGAESVLIDEISRCKPEHQNRLFALVHERRVQGIALPRLRYRWAAMNPCSGDQAGADDYTGSEPLDPALADRFALFVRAQDWNEFDDAERLRIADPGGEGRIASDGGKLRDRVGAWRAAFLGQCESCPESILGYATTVVTTLNGAGIRISPRRARLLARSLLAATIVAGHAEEALFHAVLESSLPHQTWGAAPGAEAVVAAHRLAWDAIAPGRQRWLNLFIAERALPRKLAILLDAGDTPDAGSQAVSELLAAESRDRAAAFAFAVYPLALQGRLPIGAEGVNDLGKVAAPVLSVEGEMSWQEPHSQKGTRHPDADRFARVLAGLEEGSGRRARARQFFDWCLVERLSPTDPAGLEAEIEGCVALLKERGIA